MDGLADEITMDGLACPKDFGLHGDAADQGTGDIEGVLRREPGRGICNGGDRDEHRVEMSLLPLKKRALSSDSNGRRSNSEDSYSSSPKKRRIDHCVGAEIESARGCEAPVSRHPCPVSAVTEGDALSAAVKWLNKGKWIATAETSSVAPRPQVEKKLMHDGIRSGARISKRSLHHVPRRNADSHDAEEKKQCSHTDARSGAPKPPRDVAFGAEAAVFSVAVQRRLEELGATRPWFVHRKRLEKSDVCSNQNRLLVSCKRESLAGCPITRCFSPAEMRRVEDKLVGLFVTALDRGGEPHTLTCKFLDSNSGYRFISGWGDFLKWNGLQLDARGRWTRDVDVELWAFRSRALPRQPQLGPGGKLIKGKDGKPVQGLEVADHFHQDGSLGLLLLHKENKRRCLVDSEDDEEQEPPTMPVARRREKSKKQRDKREAPAIRGEAFSGADREQDEVGTGATMSKVEMVAKFGEPTSNAVIGMMVLRGAMLRGRQENVERAAASL